MHLNYLCRMIESRDIQRFMLRAGIQVGSEDAMENVKQIISKYVLDVQKLALVHMQGDNRLTVNAKDILSATLGHTSQILVYGFDDLDESIPHADTAEEDSEVHVESGDSSSSDEENSSDDSEDEEFTANDIIDDLNYGDGEFSDVEESTSEKHNSSFAYEDSLWAVENGYVRINDTDMKEALAREVEAPYILSRTIILHLWTSLSNIQITRPALSALHNALEHYVHRELTEGKVGGQFLYSVMENLVMQQAQEIDQLEKQLAQAKSQIEVAKTQTPRKRGLRDVQCGENIPPLKVSTSVSKLEVADKRLRTTHVTLE